jgi:glycosyltransferase involved in cell wall biosynthesis
MKIVLMQLMGRGGAQLYTSQLATVLSKTNEVVVVLGDYLYEKSHYGSSAARFYFLKNYPSYLLMLFVGMNPLTYVHLYRIIKKEKPDIIHVVHEDLILGIFLILLKKRYTIVTTEHDPRLHDGEHILNRILYYASRTLSRNLSDAIIVHGQNLRNYLVEKKVPAEKIFVIPHGDFSYYKKYATIDQEEKLTLLFFGLIRDYKGLEFLIKAEPLVAEAIPGVKILIAGEGDFQKYQEMIKNPDHFEIQNRYLNDAEVAAVFSRAAIVVLPYVDASQSGIIPIAYAFKKPVIVTDVGSIAEVVEDGKTGIIVPPKNSVALSEAIITLLKNDSLRKEMGLKAYEKMQAELSWEQIGIETMKVYKTKMIR